MKVLVAGASGHLGKEVCKELQRRGHEVQAMMRRATHPVGDGAIETMAADLTKPQSLQGVGDGVDWVFSCAGASMDVNNFSDRTSFYDVDYRGNLNLLEEAKRAGVKKFAYVSLAHADQLRQTEYADAHEKFVEALQISGLDYVVIRPTGFFSFYTTILKYAKQKRGLIIGAGDCRTNPIHEIDLAEVCADALAGTERDLPIGGTETLTRKQATIAAFEALHMKPKLLSISPTAFKVLIAPLRLFNRRVYALMDFGIAVTQIDCLAPAYGSRRLTAYFAEAAKELV